MVLLQILLFAGVALVEEESPSPEVLTPDRFLAVNLSMGLTGLLTVPFVARLAGVPWRTVLSFPRALEPRRLATCLGVALVLFLIANLAMGALAPDATTWREFGVTGTTVVLLLAVVLTTPLQAAAEELMFRGAVMPAAASWIRAMRPALVLGVVLSTVGRVRSGLRSPREGALELRERFLEEARREGRQSELLPHRRRHRAPVVGEGDPRARLRV